MLSSAAGKRIFICGSATGDPSAVDLVKPGGNRVHRLLCDGPIGSELSPDDRHYPGLALEDPMFTGHGAGILGFGTGHHGADACPGRHDVRRL